MRINLGTPRSFQNRKMNFCYSSTVDFALVRTKGKLVVLKKQCKIFITLDIYIGICLPRAAS